MGQILATVCKVSIASVVQCPYPGVEGLGKSIRVQKKVLLCQRSKKKKIIGVEDVDVFIDDEDKLFNNLPFFQDNGLYLCRMIRRQIYSFKIGDNSFIDVYILGPLGFSIWTPWCYRLCTCVTPKRFFKEYQDIFFLGVQCI